MMKFFPCAVLVILGSADATLARAQNPGRIPLLGDDDVHLYVQEAYEGFSPPVTVAVEARYRELVRSGMDVGRHLFDWTDLEPAPGVFDTQFAISAMDRRRALGVTHQFANIAVVDSEGPVVPPDIQRLLDSGVPWDDPRIVGRFRSMLRAVVPVMLQRDLFMIGFANEAGSYYDAEPVLAASFTRFVQQSVLEAHTLEPQLACTAVFAGPTDTSRSHLLPLVDVASFNDYFYDEVVLPSCTSAGTPLPVFHAAAPSTAGARLDRLIAVSQGKLICIQEIGQSTGWPGAASSLGSLVGLQNQRACYEALAVELDRRRAAFRTVCCWTLNDHTRAGIGWVSAALLASGLPPCYANNIDEIFGPTGLVRSDATASKKPSFDAFKRAIAFFKDPEYGCGLNPAGSLVYDPTFPPRIGATLRLEIDNPLGTQAAGLTALAIAGAPAPLQPCGIPWPGTSMRGPGFDGELLVDLSQPHELFSGPQWTGGPLAISLPIPTSPGLIDQAFYVQGAILASPPTALGLTRAIRIVIQG